MGERFEIRLRGAEDLCVSDDASGADLSEDLVQVRTDVVCAGVEWQKATLTLDWAHARVDGQARRLLHGPRADVVDVAASTELRRIHRLRRSDGADVEVIGGGGRVDVDLLLWRGRLCQVEHLERAHCSVVRGGGVDGLIVGIDGCDEVGESFVVAEMGEVDGVCGLLSFGGV